MSIRTILLAASGGSAGQGSAELCGRLARQFGAHVEGYHVRTDPRRIVLAAGDGFGTPAVGELIEHTAQEVAELAARARRHFDEAVAEYDLPMRSEALTAGTGAAAREATAAWREDTGIAGALVPHRARYFDLVVLGRSERVINEPHTDVLEETLVSGGRPVLVAPAKAPKEIGRVIAIAWNASAESARAVAGAAPFIGAAKSVHVLTAGETDPADGALLVQALAWHGINVGAAHCPPISGIPIGQQLLTAAQQRGADLLVMGGYSRPAWREMLFGGATRQVIGNSLMPILIAH